MKARRWLCDLDEMAQDLQHLRGIRDDGEHSHGLGATRTEQGIDFIELLDQPSPGATRLLCRLAAIVVLLADVRGKQRRMVALPTLRGKAKEVGDARPPSRRASAPAGQGVSRWAHDVLGERLVRGRGACRDAEGRIEGEPRVGPLDHTFRQPFDEKLAAQEEGDDSLTEARTHPGQIHRRVVNEPALAVGASLQEQSVPAGVIKRTFGRSRALEHKDCGAADGPSCGGRSEVAQQAEDESADLAVKPPVVTKEYAKDLGEGEDELSVGQPQQKGAFLRA